MYQDKNLSHLESINRLSKSNRFVLYLYRKISKITQAIYLISDLIKDTEPAKWRLRKISIDMLSYNNFKDENSVFNDIERYLVDLQSLFEICKVSKIVSEMNVFVIQEEIGKVLGELKEYSKEGLFITDLAGDYFNIKKPEPFSFEDILNKNSNKNEDKGHKGHNVRYDFYKNTQNVELVDKVLETKHSDISKGQRRDEILRIIKDNDSITIKDISSLIKDCSEKTIQRELTSLVGEGLIKKTGERRWSRYSIK